MSIAAKVVLRVVLEKSSSVLTFTFLDPVTIYTEGAVINDLLNKINFNVLQCMIHIYNILKLKKKKKKKKMKEFTSLTVSSQVYHG